MSYQLYAYFKINPSFAPRLGVRILLHPLKSGQSNEWHDIQGHPVTVSSSSGIGFIPVLTYNPNQFNSRTNTCSLGITPFKIFI
jgi:hypothetical protein